MRTIFVMLALCAAAPAFAQRSGRIDATRDYVALVYDDTSIKDEDRAALVSFLASVIPVERWQTIQLTGPSPIDCVIDDFFDYFPSGKFETPRTVEALRSAIIRYNEHIGDQTVLPATTLRLPPFPVHAYHLGARQSKRRIFDAETRAYSIRDLGSGMRPDPSRAVNGVHGRTPCSATAARIARPDPQIADIVATTILTPALPTDLQQLSRQLSVPRKVLIFNTTISSSSATADRSFKTGFSQVELVRNAVEQPCTDGQNWLDASPYFKHWSAQKTAATLDLEAIAKRAADQPLRILDVAFTDGHGRDVLAVTKQLLKQFGFDPILRDEDKTLKPWELVPSTPASVAGALEQLTTFRNEFRADPTIFQAFEADTRLWLNAMTPVGRTFDVPDLVLASVMWHTFRDNMWVNVSSRMRAPTLRDVVDPVARDSTGVVFAAVGNTTQKLTTGFVPQDHSMVYPNIVSVTCGRAAGEICGEHSHEILGRTSPRVLLAGPGCGFVGTSGTGSSLATPYVAVASWLAHLITQRDEESSKAEINEFRRHDLLSANMPMPALGRLVESQGLFDPAYLLLRPPPHVIMKDDTLRLISDYRVAPTCVGKTLQPAEPIISESPTPRPVTETILVYTKEKKPQYWKREMIFDELGFDDCELSELDVVITFKDGTTDVYDLTSFQEKIKWITWTPYR